MFKLKHVKPGLITACMVTALVGSVTATTAPAFAATASGKAVVKTQLEPKPQISGVTPLAWVPAGTTLTLQCLATGEKAYGRLASADPYYYKVTYGGKTGYVSDSDTLTSKDATKLGLSSCSTTSSTSTGKYNAGIVNAAKAVPNYSTANNGNNCALWAEYIIRKAGGPSVALGSSNGSGYNTAWSGYATKIASLDQAKPGDIIQWYRSGYSPHTSILMSGTTTSAAVVKAGGYLGRYVYQYPFSTDLHSFGGSYYTIWRIR